MGGATNKNDLMYVGLVSLGTILPSEHEGSIEVDALKESISFDGCLSKRREGALVVSGLHRNCRKDPSSSSCA